MNTLARARLHAGLPVPHRVSDPKINTLARARLYEHQEVAGKPTNYKMLVDCYLKPLSLEVQKRMSHFTMMQQDFETEMEKRGFCFDKSSKIDEVSWEREKCDPGYEYEIQGFFEAWGLKFMEAELVTRLSYSVISIQHMIRYDRLTTVLIKRAKSKDRITVTVKLPI